MPQMTRRDFVKLGAVSAGALGATPLGFDLAEAVQVQQNLRIDGAKEVHSLCPYCAVGCSIIAFTKEDAKGHAKLLQIEGDPDSPVNEGRLCPKGATAMQLAISSRRVSKPLYRAPGSDKWQEISWDEMLDIDPRFTRTSAVSDVYARIRTGTDTAFFGGLINYVLEKNLIHHEYVKNYTNASFIVKQGFGFSEGLFSGYDPVKRIYDTSTWGYEGDAPAQAAFERAQKEIVAGGHAPAGAGAGVALAKRDMHLEHPRSVFQLMRKHYSRFTPAMVASITGIPEEQFLEIAKIVGETGRPDKVMTIVYAVGLTQHTNGGQLIRSAVLHKLM